MIDYEKRKRIMQRSRKLGHCICDPKQSCPCELFKTKDICHCAGEQLEAFEGAVQLTRLVERTGCASKIDQAFLKNVLSGLPSSDDPRVLVGVPAGDDAGIYDLGNNTALVQTVDVFTPPVDDPYQFGQIAAANSLSDIYAMGGAPITALSVIGFPVHKVPDHILKDILRGGIDIMNEASVPVIGGHSINDLDVKAGFAVTGLIEKDKIFTNAGAKPGDLLILTKPLGTGIVSFAVQIGKDLPRSQQAAIQSMTTLNAAASRLMPKFKVHACTDVTGFGLFGHLTEMARRSRVFVELIWDDLPLLPGVLDYLAAEILPGAIERNKASCSEYVTADQNVTPEMIDLGYDAQTSGGLLIALPENQAHPFLKALHSAGLQYASIIGRVQDSEQSAVHITSTGKRPIPKEKTAPISSVAPPAPVQTASDSPSDCCQPHSESTDPGSQNRIQSPQNTFSAFLSAVNSSAELDPLSKQAIQIALSVLTRCEPCLKINIQKARQMGFSQQQIDEAAWFAIAFGGSPVMMFYKNIMKSLAP